MNYRRGIALGLTIGLIVAGLLLSSLAVVSRAEADPVWTSQYGGEDGYCGLTTASGEPYDCTAYTAASPYLPMNSLVEACYYGCVIVRINDRCGGCNLDLSMAAGSLIGLPGADTAEVTIL